MPAYFLRHERVGLRPLSPAHIDGPYVDWFNDSEVCRYNSHHAFPMTRDEVEKYVKETCCDRTRLVLAVELRETEQHIGNISLQRINQVDRNAEFAILMGEKSVWGQGYAKEASLLLLRHAFQALNLHRIYCGTNSENVAMQRLAASLGMRPEGRYREAQFKHGRYLDVLRYGVLRADFLERLVLDPESSSRPG